MTNEVDALTARYREASTEVLLRIVCVEPEEYRREAVQVAREVLEGRSLSEDEVDAILPELMADRTVREDLAAAALSPVLKAVCFVFCGLPGIMIASIVGIKRRVRSEKEAWTWVDYGWLFRVVLFVTYLLVGA